MNNLGAIFYPVGTEEKPIPFESLYIPHIFKEIYFEGIYTDVFNKRENMTIIDLGANIGIVTQYMRQYAKHIYAVEPSTEHFAALTKNIEFNKWDNVSAHKVAISGKDGEATLALNEYNHTMHSLAFTDENEHGQRAGRHNHETVKTQTLATFMKENKIDEVDFIKFDTEGNEDDILRCDSFREVADKIKAIEIELHHPTYPDLINYLQTLGFTARQYASSAVVVLLTR